MYRVSWDMYKSVVREKKVTALGSEEMFDKRNPLNTAKKYARKALEQLAKEYKVDYKDLVRSLLEGKYESSC